MSTDERRAVATAVQQFNRGLYFECHETLEAVWLRLREPARDFFQGLIQVSVGCHHLRKGNHTGARRTFTRALGRFEQYPARYLGFDLAAERTWIQARLAAPAGSESRALSQPPTWRFDGLQDAPGGDSAGY